MKICPKCNRSFDDSFSFCLEDGTVLSPSFYKPGTEELTVAKTEILPRNYAVENPTLPNKKRKSVWKYALIALILICAGGLATAMFLSFQAGENNNVRNRNALNNERAVSNRTTKNTNPATPENSAKSNSQNDLKTNSVSNTIANKPTPNDSSVGSTLPKLKQGMSYQKTRELLLDNGWQAVRFPPNRELFGNMKYIIEDLGFYEVEDCSGTGAGFCRFLFRNAENKKLIVVTVNNEEGATGGPILSSWTIENE